MRRGRAGPLAVEAELGAGIVGAGLVAGALGVGASRVGLARVGRVEVDGLGAGLGAVQVGTGAFGARGGGRRRGGLQHVIWGELAFDRSLQSLEVERLAIGSAGCGLGRPGALGDQLGGKPP